MHSWQQAENRKAAEAAADSAASGASDGQVKTCNDVKSISQCSEHQGQAFAILGEDFYKGICELTDGKWTTGSCPTENALGRCDDQNGSVTLYYKTGTLSYDAAGAEKGCTDLLGKWTAL